MFSITALVARIRDRWDARYALTTVLLSGVYLVTRLYHILALPIFSDEGIYVNWARIAAGDPNWRFISLTDGKQPLQTWGTIPFVKLFPQDLLLAGRLFSVVSGYVALIAMMVLAGYLWGKRASLISGLLYIFTPYFLFYDRLALVDSAVNASTMWILFFSIVLARRRSLSVSMIFGVVAGIGLLAKSSVLMFLGLSVFGCVFFLDTHSHTKLWKDIVKKKTQLIDFGFLYGLSTCIAITIYMTQRFFSPFFHYIAEKNLTFILSPMEWIHNPFQLWPNTIHIVPLYVIWESGWITPILGLIGIFLLIRKRDPLGIYLLTWIILPFLFVISFNKVVFPRYLIFFAGILTIAATYTIIEIPNSIRHLVPNKNSNGKISKLLLAKYVPSRYQLSTVNYQFLIVICILILILLCLPQWFSVSQISLPGIDYGQYVEGATAVWGADDLMARVRVSTTDGTRAIVLAEGNFGLIADVLQAYVKPQDKIEIRGLWPLNEDDILRGQAELKDAHVFVVFSHRTDFPVSWTNLISLVKKYDKPIPSQDAVYLYEVLPVGTKR